MNYSDMTTEKLETLKSAIEEKINAYIGMSFASPRSELVTYEIDSVDSDEILINANHFFDGLIRDYTVTIFGGIDDDVEYNRYNADEDIVDGGYMSFDRLPKTVRNAVLEIYALYKEIETINNILNTRAEEEEEKEEETEEEKETEEELANLAMIIIPKSSNEKTGDIIQSYSARSTCPNRCPLKGHGCYADNYHTSRQWDRCENASDPRYVSNVKDLGLSLIEAIAPRVKKGATEVLFRHNVAGDIAQENSDLIDASRVNAIADACSAAGAIMDVTVRGYTYTHCSISQQNAKVIHEALSKNFIINYSCETVAEVKNANELGCDTVITSVNPEETIKNLKSEGIRAVQCPAQTHEDVSCESCKLCSRHRNTTIVFAVHGNGSKKARKVIMLKTEKVA